MEYSRISHHISSFNEINTELIAIDKNNPIIKINLHNNSFENLNDFPILLQLQELNLSSNFISSNISFNILSYLSNLIILDLSSNCLITIHQFPFLPQLKELKLAYNEITNLLNLDNNCPNIQLLDIRSNKIENLFDITSICKLYNLEEINFGIGIYSNPLMLQQNHSNHNRVTTSLQVFNMNKNLKFIDHISKSDLMNNNEICKNHGIDEEIQTSYFSEVNSSIQSIESISNPIKEDIEVISLPKFDALKERFLKRMEEKDMINQSIQVDSYNLIPQHDIMTSTSIISLEDQDTSMSVYHPSNIEELKWSYRDIIQFIDDRLFYRIRRYQQYEIWNHWKQIYKISKLNKKHKQQSQQYQHEYQENINQLNDKHILEIKKLQEDSRQVHFHLNKQIQKLNTQKFINLKSNQYNQEEKQELEGNIIHLQQELINKDQCIIQLKEKDTLLQNQIQQSLEMKTNEVFQMHEKVNEVEKKHEKLQNKYNSIHIQHETLQNEVNNYKQENFKLKEELQNFELKVQQDTSLIVMKYDQRMKRLIETIDTITKSNETLKEEKASLINNVKEMHDQMIKLKDQVVVNHEIKDQKIHQLQNQVNQLKELVQQTKYHDASTSPIRPQPPSNMKDDSVDNKLSKLHQKYDIIYQDFKNELNIKEDYINQLKFQEKAKNQIIEDFQIQIQKLNASNSHLAYENQKICNELSNLNKKYLTIVNDYNVLSEQLQSKSHVEGLVIDLLHDLESTDITDEQEEY